MSSYYQIQAIFLQKNLYNLTLIKKYINTLASKVYDTPRSLSPQLSLYSSGSAHSKSQNILFLKNTLNQGPLMAFLYYPIAQAYINQDSDLHACIKFYHQLRQSMVNN
jgi:hypothetical protein